jgi:NTE family protein
LLHFLTGRARNGERAAAAVIDPDLATRRDQPVIGLALGGGAARGFAHIGIVRTLIAKGLKPDVIAGTSIGAIIGGIYAAGELDAFEGWIRRLTARRVLGYLDFSLAGSGLIGGQRLARQLTAMLGETAIEDLPVRFAAIATEIGTGHEIWLTRGRLADAVSASSALPGILPPSRVGGRWLVDGALVNPVPVAAARALGARVVIAVNVNADLLPGRGTTIAAHGPDGDDEFFRAQARHGWRDFFGSERAVKRRLMGEIGRPGIATVMVEAYNIMQDRVTRSRLAGDPPDLMITPRLGKVGLFEFHRAAEIIATGAEAAERAIEPLVETIAALG